jgi:hypothetical protein
MAMVEGRATLAEALAALADGRGAGSSRRHPAAPSSPHSESSGAQAREQRALARTP